MSDTVEAATEIVADVAEEVAEHATQLAEVSRNASSHSLALAFGGFAIGAGVGAAAGYIVAKRKLETKYSEIAAEEIAEMRQHYAAKATAVEAEASKTELAKIVRDKGYAKEVESTEPPMVVAPPAAVVEAAEAAEEEVVEVVEPEPPLPVAVRNIFDENEVKDEWDYHQERARRSPTEPYVIHRDEREENDAYDEVTFTYYEADDVLCNELDEVIDENGRARIVGETNLEKFGHGSGDRNVVYIRNDNLEMDVEVVKSNNSYAEEVHGLRHSSSPLRRVRMKFDDE